jgi:hypothetical protein
MIAGKIVLTIVPSMMTNEMAKEMKIRPTQRLGVLDMTQDYRFSSTVLNRSIFNSGQAAGWR